MAWTISDNLRRLLRAGTAPIIAARLDLPALHWLDVVDWTEGAGDSVEITANSATHSIVEGVDFDAETSNSVTARAIANAWNSDNSRVIATQTRALWRNAHADRVAFIGLGSGITITIATDDAGAWDEITPANSFTGDFCSHTGRHPPALTRAAFGSEWLPVISHLTGLEWALDPISRETTPPRAELVFSNGAEIRNLVNYFNLRRVVVDLYLGADEITDFAVEYLRLPTMFIDDIVPGYGSMTLKLVDAAGDAWRDRPVAGAWTGWHPLQVVQDVLNKAGAVDGIHYAAASLDPETADPGRSHFCLSRYDDQVFQLRNALVEGKPAGELVTDLVALMGGTWRPSQTGPYEFAAFDYDASTARSWAVGPDTGHDGADVDQKSSLGDLINSVSISYARLKEGKFREYLETDAISFFESNDILSGYQFRTDWLNSISHTLEDQFPNSPNPTTQFEHVGSHSPTDSIFDDTIYYPVQYASRQGFCGTQRIDGSPTTLAPGMSMGGATGRYAVHRISGVFGEESPRRSDGINEVEYVLIDEWDLVVDLPDGAHVQAAPSGSIIMRHDAYRARITDDATSTTLVNGITIADFFGAGSQAGLRTGRGCMSTTAPPDWQDGGTISNPYQTLAIDDITIPVYVAKTIVRRFKNGAPTVSLRTNLSHIDIEIGETISLTGDDLLITPMRGDGSDSNVVWEVIGKRITFGGQDIGIEWELAFVRDDATTENILTPALPPPPLVQIAVVPIGGEREPVTDGGVIVTNGGEIVYA